eukprot:11003752-Ditylum_brightwellii.AAC.1
MATSLDVNSIQVEQTIEYIKGMILSDTVVYQGDATCTAPAQLQKAKKNRKMLTKLAIRKVKKNCNRKANENIKQQMTQNC